MTLIYIAPIGGIFLILIILLIWRRVRRVDQTTVVVQQPQNLIVPVQPATVNSYSVSSQYTMQYPSHVANPTLPPQPFSPTPQPFNQPPQPYTPTPQPFNQPPQPFTPPPQPFNQTPPPFNQTPQHFNQTPQPYTPQPLPPSPITVPRTAFAPPSYDVKQGAGGAEYAASLNGRG